MGDNSIKLTGADKVRQLFAEKEQVITPKQKSREKEIINNYFTKHDFNISRIQNKINSLSETGTNWVEIIISLLKDLTDAYKIVTEQIQDPAFKTKNLAITKHMESIENELNPIYRTIKFRTINRQYYLRKLTETTIKYENEIRFFIKKGFENTIVLSKKGTQEGIFEGDIDKEGKEKAEKQKKETDPKKIKEQSETEIEEAMQEEEMAEKEAKEEEKEQKEIEE